MKDKKTFDKLLKKTTGHLDSKKYIYRARVPEMDGRKIKKDDAGKTIYKEGEYYDPTPSKNVMLSIATNIALENYNNIRPKKDNKDENLELTEISEILTRYFSKRFYDKIGDTTTLINEKQNYDYKAIEDFRELEPKIFGTINRLRNYHSHYVHEPGILTFEDYFDNQSSLKKEDLELAKNWFEKHFDNAKTHLVSSLEDRKKKLEEGLENVEDKDILNTKIKEIKSTLNKFKYLVYLNKNKSITLNGQLFMASMFLYKRQAKIVLDKWRKFRLDKEIKGYGNSIHTFFTYYCISESYSINNFNDDLLKFREITSKLTTIPASTHEKLAPIYTKIREINESVYKEIEENSSSTPSQDNRNISELFKELEEARNPPRNPENRAKSRELALKIKHQKIQSKIMPIRKRDILTEVLLQYLYDNKLFGDNIEIAVVKTSTDRSYYYEKYDVIKESESLTAIKDLKKIKNELDKDKRKELNEHFKELKRNFIFKSIKELDDLLKPTDKKDNTKEVKGFIFSIKKKNALIRYTHKVKDKEDVKVNVTLSPNLLLKWVFIHLEDEKK